MAQIFLHYIYLVRVKRQMLLTLTANNYIEAQLNQPLIIIWTRFVLIDILCFVN